ncbi:GNAT family N-acetyltransferase [Bacillus thuringiensis]|uniref:GNAT family N-acetyltransferase n=1 Tax=Bacillus thuringiensis TaxID=1428 RepID=UPI001EE13FC3|nr:GNAT family N-acetyltransferase [Bacillus thuringiensis]MCG3424290.1 GNAT family N-acetyltransferase [Bacillus thuringiensis]
MALYIYKITNENRNEIANLKVTGEQLAFIESTVAECLVDAGTKYKGEATSVGFYDGETPIGYAMYGWLEEKEKAVYLNQFMIDSNCQGKGYAKPLLHLLIEYLQKEYDRKVIYLSIHPENKLAQKLYESIGFHLTGEIEGEWINGKGFIMKRILD